MPGLPRQLHSRILLKRWKALLAPVECVDNPALCDRSASCPTIEVWRNVRDAVEGVLAATTLESLVELQKKKEPSALQYVI